MKELIEKRSSTKEERLKEKQFRRYDKAGIVEKQKGKEQHTVISELQLALVEIHGCLGL